MSSKQLNDRLKENQMKLLCLIASSFELYKFMAVLNPRNDQSPEWKMVVFFFLN